MQQTPLVIGNWKMNPQSAPLARSLGKALKLSLRKIVNTNVVLAPPHVYLGILHELFGKSPVQLGAQNVHHEKLGSFTGETSPSMLTSFGVSYVILGHSERRREGETDEAVNKKLQAVIKANLIGVICVGETKRDPSGNYLSLVEAQLRSALKDVQKNKLKQVVIAYEPVWAIGTGDNATPGDVHEMKLFIERVLTDLYGRASAQKMRILYGGSVNKKNARELYTEGMVNGFLVGGASLHAEEFAAIIKSCTV